MGQATLERALVAMLARPHPEADLERLLEQVESLGERAEPEAQPGRLVLVVAGPDPEHRPAAGQDIERRDHLGEQAGRPVGRRGRERHQPDPFRPRGQEPESGVGLELRLVRAAHDRVLPEVVRHVDAVEPRGLRGRRDLPERRAQGVRAAVPRHDRHVQSELHVCFWRIASLHYLQ